MAITYLDPLSYDFPPVEQASDRSGLLAIGGDLSAPRLLSAYRSGIFPWYQEYGEPHWFAPRHRFVMRTDWLHVSKTLRQTLRRDPWRVTFNHDFEGVINGCATIKRNDEAGSSWIDDDFIKGYTELHRLGWAHSVEVWRDDENGQQKLVGGFYGVAMGGVFFGESMFSEVSNASKVAFASAVGFLEKLGIWLIDCQTYTQYLASFGAQMVTRSDFMAALAQNEFQPLVLENMKYEIGIIKTLANPCGR